MNFSQESWVKKNADYALIHVLPGIRILSLQVPVNLSMML